MPRKAKNTIKKSKKTQASKGFEFTFPNIFPDDDENAELQKVKEQQKKMTLNSSFANRDRNKVGEFYGV
ncbi:hypothetical protein Y032_0053g2370 [Ancylostoma ceylanicum]|uniref:Uncharacterized protein n=1 Tax=Ancylostoma ceylanicum TaxID=53326 RepID=A0A016U7L3_9BILA|nr:hypothetical protein Y032_0053g2370 [Ancylostoma ceylanicum]